MRDRVKTPDPFGLRSGLSLRSPSLEGNLRRSPGQASTRAPRVRPRANGISILLPRRRSVGFTAIEVIVSIAILAIAFVPVLSMLSSGNKESAFSEYHMIAQTRAQSIVETLSAHDWSVYASFPPQTPSVLPETLTTAAGEFPDDYRQRLAQLEESVTWTPLADGLAEVHVEIGWLLPGETASDSHRFRLVRLLARSDATPAASYVPRQGGGP